MISQEPVSYLFCKNEKQIKIQFISSCNATS